MNDAGGAGLETNGGTQFVYRRFLLLCRDGVEHLAWRSWYSSNNGNWKPVTRDGD